MKRRQKRDNFIVSMIMILCTIIIILTVYFVLDVFGIIKVPAQYSIASLFYSQIDVIATSGITLTDDDLLPDTEPKNTIENEFFNNKVVDEVIVDEQVENQNNVNPLEELDRLEQERLKQEENDNTVNNVNSEFFYYEQLDEYGKIIYTELYNNLDNLKTGTCTVDFDTTFNELLHLENGSEILNNAFQLAINALTFDNPDLFYIDITKINLITETTTRPFSVTYRVSIGGNGRCYLADEFPTTAHVNNAIGIVDDVKSDIISKTGEDLVENLKIIHDYLIDTVEYEVQNGKNVYNVYGALVDKKSVCEGYARAYKLILDEMGIECIIACGIGRNSAGETESHAWNYVKIDDVWYAIDVTWDDPVIIGNGHITDEIKYHYFLKGSDEFFIDHFEDGNLVGEYNFAYPEISKTNY